MHDADRHLHAEVIRLRGAENTDAPFLLWLEEVCMKKYATALWGEWRPSATLESVDLTGHEIIEVADQAAGCVATAVHPDHLLVKRLYLALRYRNRGIGALVLRRLIQIADARAIPVKLSVLTTNPAVRFYRREGFSVQAETRERRTMIRAPAIDPTASDR